jgi:transposase
MLGEHEPDPQACFFFLPEIPSSAKRELLLELHRLINWTFVRELARPFFKTEGRPSIDPIVMIKMMVVGMLFSFTSDRRLVEECADSWAITEFLGYRPGERLPVHSNFTNWRKKLGPDFFRDALHQIVAQALALGLPLSTSRSVDGTSVKAQASKQGPKLEMPVGADPVEFVEQIFRGEIAPVAPAQEKTIPVNLHDPEARLQRKKGETAEFRYCASVAVCTETGLICDATATPREQAATAVEHVRHDPLGVTEIALDRLYDDGEALGALQAEQVTCYVPRTHHDKAGQLSKDEFTYHADVDEYACPAGQRLRHTRYDAKRQQHFYVAPQAVCRNCPRKAECTPAKRRSVSRADSEPARTAAVRRGLRYDELKARRQTNEHVHLLGKRDHGLRRARGIGLAAMRIQVCLTALAINLKKLVRWTQVQRAEAQAQRAQFAQLGQLAQLAQTTQEPVRAFFFALRAGLRQALGGRWGAGAPRRGVLRPRTA